MSPGLGFLSTGAILQPRLLLDGPKTWAISAASWSGGIVTFTLSSANSGYTVGSEFEVTGVTPAGYNGAYVAIHGTSGATIVANHLSGPVGVPSALSSLGAGTVFGVMQSVLMPGMQVFGMHREQGSLIHMGHSRARGTGSTQISEALMA